MPKNYTWDQIRSQVRAFRASNQTTPSSQSLAVIKDFYIDARKQQIYFLANSYNLDGCPGRQLTLYQTSYVDNTSQNQANGGHLKDSKSCECGNYISWLSRQPILEWKPAFSEYITVEEETVVSIGPLADENRQGATLITRPIQGATQYQFCGEVVMFTYMGAVFCSRFGKIPTLVPHRPPPHNETYFLSLQSPASFSSSPSSEISSADTHPPHQAANDRNVPSTHGGQSMQPVRADPKLGGEDNDLIAFIRDRDLWVTTLDGFEVQLTHCSSQTNDPTISCGTAEYVMQEEFHRYTGYYWGPPTADGRNRILYLETSEDSVDVVVITKPSTLKSSKGETMRYPRAGRANARSELCIVEFGPVQENNVGDIVVKRMWNKPLNERYPWIEYITRFGWLPDGQGIWAQILSRDQKKALLIRIPTTQFTTERTDYNNIDVEDIEILWDETTDIWINVSDVYYFFERPSQGSSLDFIWSSELSGYRHLYLVTKNDASGTFQRTQLTFGDWCVSDHPLYVDEERRLVYFMARKDTPVELHLYVASFGGDATSIKRLTEPGFSHTATVNVSANIFVDCFSNLHHPQCVVVRHLVHENGSQLPCVANDKSTLLLPISEIKENDDLNQDPIDENTAKLYSSRILASPMSHISSPLNLPTDTELQETNGEISQPLPKGEIFSFKNPEGILLYGYLYKPRNYQPGHSYPTILHIYGGPKTQMVTNDYKLPRLQRYLMSVYFGFAVVVIDGRGSSDRGLEFESYIKDRLGLVEIEDQIAGLQHIYDAKIGAEPTTDNRLESVIDMTRVAITGWSYGGYLSLMGLAQRPDIFKIAIAGAPVTQWELYDSAYTERYMGLPSTNSKAYNDSSVLSWVERFPDSEHRLLIAHGLIDENVHFTNTEFLVSKLVKHNKPHYLQVYPTEKHGLRHASVNEHFETLMFFWLLNYL